MFKFTGHSPDLSSCMTGCFHTITQESEIRSSIENCMTNVGLIKFTFINYLKIFFYKEEPLSTKDHGTFHDYGE